MLAAYGRELILSQPVSMRIRAAGGGARRFRRGARPTARVRGRSASCRTRALACLPLILEPVFLAAPRQHREHGIQSVEGLDRRLLVDGEDDGVGRRGEIEANDVGRTLLTQDTRVGRPRK